VGVLRFSVFLLAITAFAAFAADPKLDGFLKNVEGHYNRAKTLEVPFTERYTPPGRIQRMESGVLLLRKPGRMRGDYDQPKGKLFVSDGTYLYLYTPGEPAQKVKLKESFGEDVRAPLAFLLGHLDFNKDFKDLQGRPEGANTRVIASPKGDALPYSAVEFLITPDYRMQELQITLTDHSLISFTFGQEVMNPNLNDKLFVFQLPAGAQWDPSVGK
jgi:outer membrane lipoprotein carrier protein